MERSVREYLLSIGVVESQDISSGYRTEFTIYDSSVDHVVSFISNSRFDSEPDGYFDVYFGGFDYDNHNSWKFATVYSRMRITTIEEVKFIMDHLVYDDTYEAEEGNI